MGLDSSASKVRLGLLCLVLAAGCTDLRDRNEQPPAEDGGDDVVVDMLAAGLVVTEIDYDMGYSEHAPEWVELYNPTKRSVSLAGHELVLGDGESGQVYRTISLDDAGMLEPYAYLVVGAEGIEHWIAAGKGIVSEALRPEERPFEVEGDDDMLEDGREHPLSTAGDAVFLIDRRRGQIVDRVAYEGEATIEIEGFGAVSGIEQTPTVALDDVEYGSVGSLCRGPQNADTDDSRADWLICTEPTPGGPNIRIPSLIINEVDPTNGGDEREEYIEIINTGSTGMLLRDMVLVLLHQHGPYREIDLEIGGVIGTGSYVVVGTARSLFDRLSPAIDPGDPIDFIRHEGPAAIALIDTATATVLDGLSYGGDITGTLVPYVRPWSFDEARALTVVDTGPGTLCRDDRDIIAEERDWLICPEQSVGSANFNE